MTVLLPVASLGGGAVALVQQYLRGTKLGCKLDVENEKVDALNKF
jgi:hypothetical protein